MGGPESVIVSEINQTEKEKYHMASLIRWTLKKQIQMNLLTEQRFTDLEKELMVAEGKG